MKAHKAKDEDIRKIMEVEKHFQKFEEYSEVYNKDYLKYKEGDVSDREIFNTFFESNFHHCHQKQRITKIPMKNLGNPKSF